MSRKLIIAGMSVNINSDGLYCLNDLHKAAVKEGMADENSHRPSTFKVSQSEFCRNPVQNYRKKQMSYEVAIGWGLEFSVGK